MSESPKKHLSPNAPECPRLTFLSKKIGCTSPVSLKIYHINLQRVLLALLYLPDASSHKLETVVFVRKFSISAPLDPNRKIQPPLVAPAFKNNKRDRETGTKAHGKLRCKCALSLLTKTSLSAAQELPYYLCNSAVSPLSKRIPVQKCAHCMLTRCSHQTSRPFEGTFENTQKIHKSGEKSNKCSAPSLLARPS